MSGSEKIARAEKLFVARRVNRISHALYELRNAVYDGSPAAFYSVNDIHEIELTINGLRQKLNKNWGGKWPTP